MYSFISHALTQSYILTTQLKQLSITDFAIVTKGNIFWRSIVTSPQLICDVMLTYCTGIVTSYSLIVVVRANWHKGSLHQWITAVNIDFSPPGIHGLVCKKKGHSMSSVHFPQIHTFPVRECQMWCTVCEFMACAKFHQNGCRTVCDQYSVDLDYDTSNGHGFVKWKTINHDNW